MERVFARRTRGGGGPGRAWGRGGPRTWRGLGPNGSGQEAALRLCNTRGGKRKPRKSPSPPHPPSGAGFKKKKKSQKSIMEAKLPWNLTLLPLHFWVSGTQTALLWYTDHAFFFFFLIFFFFLSFCFKSCFTTLHLYFTYNFSHNHHNSSHKQARGGITFLQHRKLGLRGIK